MDLRTLIHKSRSYRCFDESYRINKNILNVLALGKPAEIILTVLIGEDGDFTYYRDAEDVHHVPKRSLAELIVKDVEN